jgi:hypothetical protein
MIALGVVIKMKDRPDRPQLRRLGKTNPSWLLLEPARIALISGVCFSTLALTYFFIRQLSGVSMGVQDVIVGVALTFLVSYAATGLFMIYLLSVAEREIPIAEKMVKKRRHLTGKDADEGAEVDSTQVEADIPEMYEEESVNENNTTDLL